jgi:hypothetical protein
VVYRLRAFIGHLDTLEAVKRQLQAADIIPLAQDVGIIPITGAIYEILHNDRPYKTWDMAIFKGLFEPLIEFAVRASARGPIAYAEAEYFSGQGYQAVVVWQDETEVLGPLWAYKLPLSEKPINRALRMLGVKIKNAVDEFDTLGLGACHHTEDWVNRLGDKSR